MKTLPILFLCLYCYIQIGCLPDEERPGKISMTTVMSQIFEIDGLYKSMLGPYESQSVQPVSREPELIWLTGFESMVMDEEGETQLSQEFMCHSNLKFKNPPRSEIFQSTRHRHSRLFTISQGQFGVDFPSGFGIPIMGNELLALDNQVLNMNVTEVSPANPLKMRYRNNIYFIKEKDTRRRMNPLYQIEAGVMVALEGREAYYNRLNASAIQAGAICAPGVSATSKFSITRFDEVGQHFSYHWVLAPGKEIRRTLITQMLDLQFDTRIHFIAVHMHPFAEQLILKDLNEDKVVFVSHMEDYEDKIGLRKTDFFSSVEGLSLYKDHEYELVSVYNNTSGTEQDAMALIYLYLEDRRFSKKKKLKG